MPFLLTVAQFIRYKDVNRIRELLSDDTDGVPIPTAQLTTNTTLIEIINAGETEVTSAAQVGNAYTIGELVCLANDNSGGTATLVAGDYVVTGGTTINGSGAKLRSLVAAVAWAMLVDRKGYPEKEFAVLAPGYKMAMQQLNDLQLGKRIFPTVTGTPEAGLPGVEALGVNVVGSINQCVGLFGNIALANRWQAGQGGSPGDYYGW